MRSPLGQTAASPAPAAALQRRLCCPRGISDPSGIGRPREAERGQTAVGRSWASPYAAFGAGSLKNLHDPADPFGCERVRNVKEVTGNTGPDVSDECSDDSKSTADPQVGSAWGLCRLERTKAGVSVLVNQLYPYGGPGIPGFAHSAAWIPLMSWWRVRFRSADLPLISAISGQVSPALRSSVISPRSSACPTNALLKDLRMLPISNKDPSWNPAPYQAAATSPLRRIRHPYGPPAVFS